ELFRLGRRDLGHTHDKDERNPSLQHHARRISNSDASAPHRLITQVARCVRAARHASVCQTAGMFRALAIVAVLAAVARADDNPSLAALLARTNDIAKEVAHVRGLKLKHPIPNEVVDRVELRKRLLEVADDKETAHESEVEGLAMKRWGMVPLDYDYTGGLVDLMTDQIAGYYDAKTKKMTILDSAAGDRDWAEMVLAHELDH